MLGVGGFRAVTTLERIGLERKWVALSVSQQEAWRHVREEMHTPGV